MKVNYAYRYTKRMFIVQYSVDLQTDQPVLLFDKTLYTNQKYVSSIVCCPVAFLHITHVLLLEAAFQFRKLQSYLYCRCAVRMHLRFCMET